MRCLSFSPVRSGAKPLLGLARHRCRVERPKGPERAETPGPGACASAHRRAVPVQPPTGAGDGAHLYPDCPCQQGQIATCGRSRAPALTERAALWLSPGQTGNLVGHAWPSRSYFRGREARRSAWAPNWPRPTPAARAVFDEVDAALGQKLSELMFNGPLETLTLTENAQPALMAVSLAVMRVLEAEKGFSLAGKVKYVAGHSLGEYSALAAAGALSLGRCGAPPEDPRPGHADGRAGRARRHGRPAGCRQGCRGEAGGGSRTGRGVPARQRQRADAGRHFRRQERHRPRRPARQGAWRAPLHAAQCQRTVPLRADATRCRRDGRSVGPRGRQAARCSADRQRAGGADLRSRRDQAAPRRAGHGHGALARMRRRHGRCRALRISTRSDRARCWQVSPSASCRP